MNKVKVCAVNGKVVTPFESNPEFGFIRVEQTVSSFNENGFMESKTRSALIRGSVKELSALGWADGEMIPGHIVIKEQLTPTNPNNADQDLKRAGEEGPILTKDGEKIYRTAFYSTSPVEDTIIKHTNVDEVAAYAAEQAAQEAGTDLEQG